MLSTILLLCDVSKYSSHLTAKAGMHTVSLNYIHSTQTSSHVAMHVVGSSSISMQTHERSSLSYTLWRVFWRLPCTETYTQKHTHTRKGMQLCVCAKAIILGFRLTLIIPHTQNNGSRFTVPWSQLVGWRFRLRARVSQTP